MTVFLRLYRNEMIIAGLEALSKMTNCSFILNYFSETVITAYFARVSFV